MKISKMLRKTQTSLILLLLVLATIGQTIDFSHAQTSTEIVVTNPLKGDENFIFHINTTIPGSRFNATVWVYNVTDLFAYQASLNVSDTLLNITNAWIPDWDSNWVFYDEAPSSYVMLPPAFYDRNDDTSNERVMIGASLLLGATTLTGDGILAIIELEIIQMPPQFGNITSILNIENEDTYLLNSQISPEISTTKTSGNYEYIWVSPATKPRLEVSPSLIEFGPLPPHAIGEEFNVTVLIRNLSIAWYLKRIAFYLNYTSSLIEWKDYTLNKLWGSSSSLTMPTPGMLLVYVDDPETTPIGNVEITRIKFEVKSQGYFPKVDTTSLLLNNITLWDTTSQQILPDPPVNGTVIIKGLPAQPWLEMSPAKIEFRAVPPSAIGQNFTVNMVIKNVNVTWKLANISFALTYNQTLLTAQSVDKGSFMPSFGTTIHTSSLLPGKVTVNQHLLNSPTKYPSGEGIVATFTFNILAQGPAPENRESPLNIIDIQLTDEDDNNIPVNSTRIVHGQYQIKSLESSSVSVNVSPNPTTEGSSVTIEGSVNPKRDNVTVTIYHRTANGTWTVLKTVKTDSNSHYSFIWAVNKTGELEIKAKWNGDVNTAGDESDITQLIVKQEVWTSSILLYVIIGIAVIIIAILAVYFTKAKKTQSIDS